MSERIYVGKGKLVGKFQQLKVGLEVDKLTKNDRGYCNIIITTMREPDKHGNTHTAYIDDYVPQQRQENNHVDYGLPQHQSDMSDSSDLPF